MLKIWCLLFIFLFSLNITHATPRTNVVIFGTTLGPEWRPPNSGDMTFECPYSHPYILNGGLTCCRHMGRNDNVSLLLKYYDPPEMCDVTWPCPDPRRLCRKYDGLPVNSECPLSHSYPLFGNGKFCCKWYKRANDPSKHPLCDGGMLKSTDPLECCPNGDYEVCDGGWAHCKQIVDHTHCPKSPDFQRREGQDHGYSSEGKLSYTKALETCQAKGAMLPSFDKGNDVAEDIADFLPYTYLVTGLRRPVDVRCVGAACDGKLVWAPSNETFTWQPWMEDLQGPKVFANNANVCFFYLRSAHLRWFSQDACNKARDAYCVFSCLPETSPVIAASTTQTP